DGGHAAEHRAGDRAVLRAAARFHRGVGKRRGEGVEDTNVTFCIITQCFSIGSSQRLLRAQRTLTLKAHAFVVARSSQGSPKAARGRIYLWGEQRSIGAGFDPPAQRRS